MAPFRPTYVNKRYYPGNASVIGPTTQASLGISTVGSCSSTVSCGACACQTPLGCRCFFCGCPCCSICCCCPITTCTQTVPGGKWSKWEQYESSTRNSWGTGITTTTGTAVCLCCTAVGYTCCTNSTDCSGFFVCCSGATKWFVAPLCTEPTGRSWYSRSDGVTCANSIMGSLSWFTPSSTQYQGSAGCNQYWDDFARGFFQFWWTDTELNARKAQTIYLKYANFSHQYKNNGYRLRAHRTV